MCWKWRYSCGHVADIRCRAPIRNPNDPEDDKLGYSCSGLPNDYTDTPVPCQNCLINEAPTRDDKNSMDDNKGGANHDAGRGNDSRKGYMRAEGWINVTDIGSWPWDKSWMPGMVGMKYNEEGYIVDDPDSMVRYHTMIMTQDTYQFDMDAEYNNLTHDLEALSNNPAYAKMESELEFRQPTDAARRRYIIRGGPVACGGVTTSVTSPLCWNTPTPSLSPVSSRSASPASVFSVTDLQLDTPASQLSFNAIDISAIPILPADPGANNFGARFAAADAGEDLSIPV